SSLSGVTIKHWFPLISFVMSLLLVPTVGAVYDRPHSLTVEAALRSDGAGVETQPVHPSQVAGVFDFHATVDHNFHSGLFGNTGALETDHAELQPERACSGRDGVTGDTRDGIGRAKHVHNVDAERDFF